MRAPSQAATNPPPPAPARRAARIEFAQTRIEVDPDGCEVRVETAASALCDAANARCADGRRVPETRRIFQRVGGSVPGRQHPPRRAGPPHEVTIIQALGEDRRQQSLAAARRGSISATLQGRPRFPSRRRRLPPTSESGASCRTVTGRLDDDQFARRTSGICNQSCDGIAGPGRARAGFRACRA